ncbi:MAG: hypothetical protein IKP99_02845 [Bacteroidales bacterium]|nr:hypothetical protein [Bacteroidales bacterium]MBR6265277.1 hypothetical protein [Bacteroidales bacterium]
MKNFLFILSTLLVFGCKHENPEYDSIPFVEFLSAPTVTDSSDRHIYFNFMLYDGDGNFGLETFDTASPFVDEFQQNFHSVPFYIENKETLQLPYAINYRIPRLRNEGNNKFIKAKVTIDIVLAKASFPYDSVLFTYFVYDRDLQKSNVDTSQIITFK